VRLLWPICRTPFIASAHPKNRCTIAKISKTSSIKIQHICSCLPLGFQTRPALHLIIGTHLSHRLRNGPLVIPGRVRSRWQAGAYSGSILGVLCRMLSRLVESMGSFPALEEHHDPGVFLHCRGVGFDERAFFLDRASRTRLRNFCRCPRSFWPDRA
jgi:hypothetical protein